MEIKKPVAAALPLFGSGVLALAGFAKWRRGEGFRLKALIDDRSEAAQASQQRLPILDFHNLEICH